MTDTTADDTTERTHPLTATRVEQGVYVAQNERGGQVRVGLPGAEGALTPGELLQIAAATCAALSADHVLGSRLGRDFDASLTVDALKITAEERYEEVTTRLVTDLSEVDPDRLDALIRRAHRAIDRLCTVGRTLEHGAASKVSFIAEDPS